MKLVRIMLAVLLTLAMLVPFAACTGGEKPAESTTEKPDDGSTVVTTKKEDVVTTVIETEPTGAPETTSTSPYGEDELFTWKGHQFATVSGFAELKDDTVELTSRNMIALVLDDTLQYGKLTATLTSKEDNASNDNGIVFGIDNEGEDYFWESERNYYFLFVSDGGNLYLAEVAYNGSPWNVCFVSPALEGYTHGDTFTITAEILPDGVINCYFNDELQFTYTDADPNLGTMYGIRSEEIGVVYHDMVVEKAE